MGNINCLQCEFRHPDNGNCTGVGGFCTAVPAAHCPLLRQYLGTRMTPAQAANAKTIIESAFAEDPSKAERIRKLLAADKEGRCIILPCKVYETDGVRVYEHTVREVIYETAGGPAFDKNAIGKSIFLTRAEAERAIQEMEGKG